MALLVVLLPEPDQAVTGLEVSRTSPLREENFIILIIIFIVGAALGCLQPGLELGVALHLGAGQVVTGSGGGLALLPPNQELQQHVRNARHQP